MRLSCALVSTFLFVSAVLAAYDPEKQQPPFLNRVEKSINSTTVRATAELAGIIWMADSEEHVEIADGTFTAPRGQDNVDSIFTIMVAIGNSGCDSPTDNDINVSAGIIGRVIPNQVTYRAFTQWGGGDVVWGNLPISAGNRIAASITLTTTTRAFVQLMNVDQNSVSWSQWIDGPLPDSPPGCKQSVKWVIEAPPYDNMPLPNFDSVAINDMLVKVFGSDTETVPRRPDILAVDINRDDRVETGVMFYGDYVAVVYIPKI